MTDFDKTLHAQLRHLIDDLTVAVDDDGHTLYAPKNTLMFGNFIGALIELMPTLAARAQPAQAVPPGYVLVPVEPTPEIVAVMAVQEASGSINGTKTIGMAGAVAAYDAMLATAQGEKP